MQEHFAKFHAIIIPGTAVTEEGVKRPTMLLSCKPRRRNDENQDSILFPVSHPAGIPVDPLCLQYPGRRGIH
jgi:hypothetical protein